MRFLTWLGRQRFPYEPLIEVSISKSRLLHNLEEFRKLTPGAAVAPVLKANAYGHGLFEVADILDKIPGIPFFVVDSYFEAVALRARHVKAPLLVLGYTRPETIARSDLRHTAYAITSMETLRRFSKDKPEAPEGYEEKSQGPYHIAHMRHVHIHLKIDTGMHRQGIQPEEVAEALAIIEDNDALFLEGICTHLCDADNADESFTEGQIRIWNRVVAQFKSHCPNLKYIHAAATDGSRFSSDIHGNVVRLGIGLYGLSENPSLNSSLRLLPVLSMITILTDVKRVKAGQTIGYGNTFRAMNDMIVATVPVGYFEGLDRRMSSGPSGETRGFVQVNGERILCPIVGRVSMDISTIDVSKVKGAVVGMEAVIVSDNAVDPNSARNIAKSIGTISYEVAVKIPAHLRRVVVD